MIAERTETVFSFKGSELNQELLDRIRREYPNQPIELRILQGEMDATEFVMSKPKLVAALEQARADLDAGKGRLFTPAAFEDFAKAHS